MTINFHDELIDLSEVMRIGPVAKNRFKAYSGDTFSFSVHLSSIWSPHAYHGREIHLVSPSKSKMEAIREDLEAKVNNWRYNK